MTDFSAPSDVTAMLEHAGLLSRYVRRLLANPPELFDAAQIVRPLNRQDMRRLLETARGGNEQGLHRRLRHLRQAVLLQIIARDLNGLATLDEVLDTITAFAEEAVCFTVGELGAAAER